ncbi:MAG: hypothetical protein BGO68_01835 [Candidatus Amoebophilus sp. 36-38]|nr:MAG: hypothetical protein BGO68_01835 [Candidatus Amoebophilus sp. 36-38]
MKYRKKENVTDSLAIILSLAIHGLLLLGAYYLPLYHGSRSASTPYKIELDLQAFREVLAQPKQDHSAEQVETPTLTATDKPVMEQTISGDAVPLEEVTQTPDLKELEQENSVKEAELKQEQPLIDDRGLYKATEDKKTGASLELIGWTWDSVPHPQDNTNEVGRIVFEITIDDSGEIIAIKTLEKTVSPLVEQLYKDEVAKLTFSKTNMNMGYAPTSTGKITFILQYK